MEPIAGVRRRLVQRDARLWPHGPLADAVLPPPRLSGDEGVAEAMLKYGAMSFVEDALAQRAKLTKSRHASQGVRHKHPHKPRPALARLSTASQCLLRSRAPAVPDAPLRAPGSHDACRMGLTPRCTPRRRAATAAAAWLWGRRCGCSATCCARSRGHRPVASTAPLPSCGTCQLPSTHARACSRSVECGVSKGAGAHCA